VTKANDTVVLRLVLGARIVVNGSNDAPVDLPADAQVSADSDAGSITLSFDKMALALTFSGASDKNWALSNLTLNYGGGEATKAAEDDNGILGIHAHSDNAYACKAEEKIKLDDVVSVIIVGLKVQPFMTGSENDFSKAEICEADKEPNNVVPIAVGAALAALVVLVLILYLIGRRKHQRGYQTV